jgi:hypothetical protein
LGIYTNTPGDAGNGTLRAVFTQGGTFAIGNAVSSSSFGDFGNFVLKHNGNSEIALVKADASGVDVGVALRCYSSRGTVAAPLAVQSGDYLSRISGFGWDGTSYGNFGANIGRNGGFNVIAEENFTSNAHGTALSFEFTPRGSTAGAEGMRFTSDSRLGIGTATPGASLDVNGTLKVGDFGGATNVMVKPNNTASAVGQVIPILRGNYITNVAHQAVTALPAGTWFVYLTAADNSLATQATDEDLHFCMAKVWTVPAGQFLRFGNLNKVPTTTDTTMGYWLDGSDTVKANATGFIEFKTTATGDAKAWQANGGNISATNAPSIFYDSGSADGPNGLINWAGYAIRIA